MILEAAALRVKPGQSEAFEAAFRQAQAIIASMPGYLCHELQRCVEREGEYLLLVHWRSVAAHEEGFRKSPQYQEWKRLLHHFYEPFPTVLHYEPVTGGAGMDTDLAQMSRDRLVAEVRTLRDGIRKHRDSSGHELCWHHPDLWRLLPEKTDPTPTVPAWPQFMRGCIRYRQSLDEQAPDAPRTSAPYDGKR